ncbi:MAG TPA: hypothetical protein VN956_25485 [Pyrinomonadaceae bacterium]|nr:hypothetical protein [Pyrinomonadaceae bacterium]
MFQDFQPPFYWQQFEDLTEAVFPYLYGGALAQKIGRAGQAQHGVDVYGQWLPSKSRIGIQCKRMDELDEQNQPRPGGAVTKRLLYDEYEQALKFRPKLDEWILATTAKRDEKAQRLARLLDKESQDRGDFAVRIWFWDDYRSYLNNFGELQRRYYRHVLNVRSSKDIDKLTLEVYAHAFSRPAFQDPIYSENADDFLQAIQDTMRALNTGELVDRETRNIIRRAIGGRRSIQEDVWRLACDKVYRRLLELKTTFQSGLKDGMIVIKPYDLQIERGLKMQLEYLRESAVAELNSVLKMASLRPI